MFETHGLTGNIAYSCDDTFSLVSLISAGLGIGFAPEWTKDLPNRGFELRPVRGVDLKIGLGLPGTRTTRLRRGMTSSTLPGRWRGQAGEEPARFIAPLHPSSGSRG